MMKIKKRKKNTRAHGKGMGTSGWGARKKHKKSGHRGGKGMAGTGKRGDQKKTKILTQYGHGYFGKKGITSVGTKRDKRDRINLQMIEANIENFVAQGIAKESKGIYEMNLKTYKILGSGALTLKVNIHAKEASPSALKKVKKAGGEIILPKKEIKTKRKKEQVSQEKH